MSLCVADSSPHLFLALSACCVSGPKASVYKSPHSLNPVCSPVGSGREERCRLHPRTLPVQTTKDKNRPQEEGEGAGPGIASDIGSLSPDTRKGSHKTGLGAQMTHESKLSSQIPRAVLAESPSHTGGTG